MKQCQEICLRVPEMSAEQSTTHEESRRTLSIGDTLRTMARNQHQHY